MAETWYPILVDPTDLNEDSNVAPDWANDKIYTWPSFSQDKIWTSNISTGVLTATKTMAAICVISSNTFINGSAIVLGTDSNLYAMTSHSGDLQGNARLSKIDTATMTETAAAIPYAITNKVAEGYSISGAGDWRLSAFQLNGVDYLALLLNGSDPANIEIFNCAALTSVVTFNYTTQGGVPQWMVVGEQPTSSTQKLYLMQEAPNGDETEIGLVAVTFNNAPSISDSLISNVTAVEIDPTWTQAFPLVDPDPLDLMFCSTDNSLVFCVLNDVSDPPNLPPITKVVKANSTSGAVEWTVQVSNAVFSLANTQFAQAAALSDLSCCTLVFCDPNSTTYYIISVPDGTSTSATSTYFDGSPADNGVRFPAVWDSVRQRLIYYYEGSTNTSSQWPFGGWAVWGPDGDLGCCGSPPSPPPMPPAPTPTTGRYFIERMDNRIWATIEDAWCLDCALSYPQPTPDATITASSGSGSQNIALYNIINGGSGYTAPTGQVIDIEGGGTGATMTLTVSTGTIITATAVTIGSGYLHPTLSILDATGSGAVVQPIVTNYVTVSATASVFTSTSVGDIIRVGGGKLEVVFYSATDSVVANVISPITATAPDDPFNTVLSASSGDWTMTTPTTSVSGLAHLEGMTVNALADGGVVNDLTVTDGSVTLPYSASQILVGLPFIAQAQTMYLDTPGGPTVQTRRKSGVQAVLRVENSRAPEVGVNQPDAAVQPNQAEVPWTQMTQIKYRTPSMPAGQPAPLFSGDLDITNLFGGYDTRGQVAIQQTDPLPLSITAVIPWVTVGDSPGQ